MMRRKLDTHEKYWIAAAADAVRSLMRGCECTHPWDKRFADLIAVDEHGTTDGKPWQEPQPEIGEGYRYALESDVNRLDVERWDAKSLAWHFRDASRKGEPLDKEITYRVPVDRIPTDEDAVGRPTVMVRDYGDDKKWQPGRLIEVDHVALQQPFYVRTTDELESFWWDECRFPYPGEVIP